MSSWRITADTADSLQAGPVLEETFNLETLRHSHQLLHLLLPHADQAAVHEVQQSPGLSERNILRNNNYWSNRREDCVVVLPPGKRVDLGKYSPTKRCGNMERKPPKLFCDILEKLLPQPG